MILARVRNTPPADADHLWHWVRAYTGVRVARCPVCHAHRPPLAFLAALVLAAPPTSLVLGPRGGGKSFLTAVATHLDSRNHPGLGTRILGGSKAQSAQVYEAIREAVLDGRGPGGTDRRTLAGVLAGSARYRNGSHVDILAASSKSVRGPHVPRLRLDEVDEIDPVIREASLGMCMAKHGVAASVSMSSTWHRVGGPMTDLLARGEAGAFPVFRFCAFEVLERCSADRSGPWVGGDDGYARCPECPLKPWCHAERDLNGGVPLAKLSDGHYAIDSLVQKVHNVSRRVFEADYLCKGPKADGVWFRDFDRAAVVTESAEFDPLHPVKVGVDSGVWTGAVALQSRKAADGRPLVTAFWDYLAEGRTARQNAAALLEGLARWAQAKRKYLTDPAGGARNPVGPTVLAEFRDAGLKPLEPWPGGPVADGLAIVEALLSPASGSPRLLIHPRCTHLIAALEGYLRKKRAGQWLDEPEDPQHPAEDLVDALRGVLKAEFPEGLTLPARTVVPTDFRRAIY